MRYDGHTTTEASLLFPDTLGLLSDACARLLVQDSFLWVGTVKEGALRLNLTEGTFQHWPHIPEDATSLPDPRITLFTSWDRQGITLVGTHLHGVVAIGSDGQIVRQIRPSAYVPVVNERSIDVITSAASIPGTDLLVFGTLEGILLYDWEADTLARYVPSDSNTQPADQLTPQSWVIRTLLMQGDTVVWAGSWGGGLLRFHLGSKRFKVLLFEPNGTNDAFTNNIRHLQWWDESHLLVPSTHSNGFLYNIEQQAFSPWLPLQMDKAPHSYYSLAKGRRGYWVGTAQGNIYYVSNALQYWTTDTTVFQVDQRVYLGSDRYQLERNLAGQNFLSAYQDDQLIFRKPLPVNPDFEDQINRAILLAPQGIVVVTSRDVWLYGWQGEILHHFSNGEMATRSFNGKLPSIISATLSQEKVWIGTKGSGLLQLNLRDRSIAGLHKGHNIYPLVHDFWINTVDASTDEVWYGTEEGIGVITTDTAYAFSLATLRSHLQGRDKALLKEVFDLHPLSRDECILVSPKGIFLLELRSNQIDNLQCVLCANEWVKNFRSIHPVGANTYWVSTSDYWLEWDFTTGNKQPLDLPKIISQQSHWIGQSGDPALQWKQVQLTRTANIPDSTDWHIYLRDLSLGGRESIPTLLSPKQEIELDYNANFFSFSAQFIGTPPIGNTLYFRLKDWVDEWQPLQEGRAGFSNLSPGTYTLEVEGRDLNGDTITPTFQQPFSIATPFWLTWWFVLSIATVLAGGAALIYHLCIRQVRKEERLRKSFLHQIQELEVKALRAQMNPHFMFNCLNSIRNLMLKGELDEAVEYITKFARLLRLILQHSKQDLITLQDEMEALELYLELEKLRLDEKLNYTITIANDLQPAQQSLPPMICQPYVENAIWHGLLNKSAGGTVQINATLENGTLVIQIEDDGAGREAAKAIAAKNQTIKRQSYGMSLIKDRLAIMRDWKHIDTTVEIQDLYESGSPSGTRVTLKLKMNDQSHPG